MLLPFLRFQSVLRVRTAASPVWRDALSGHILARTGEPVSLAFTVLSAKVGFQQRQRISEWELCTPEACGSARFPSRLRSLAWSSPARFLQSAPECWFCVAASGLSLNTHCSCAGKQSPHLGVLSQDSVCKILSSLVFL